jgi:hypothetical protein
MRLQDPTEGLAATVPDTLLGLALAVAFVLPGFVIADLAETRRATRTARSDLELVLRGLV